MADLQSFLGFFSYYQRFVKGFAKIARPLNDLLKNERAVDVSNSLGQLHKDKGPRYPQESIQAEWTEQCEQAFDQEEPNQHPDLGLCRPELPL